MGIAYLDGPRLRRCFMAAADWVEVGRDAAQTGSDVAAEDERREPATSANRNISSSGAL